MLDEHFEEQMNEIIKLCPVKRQTMLFSATMTDKVGYGSILQTPEYTKYVGSTLCL